MIFIVYFIGSIGLIYCRLIFKLANRKRGHTICTRIMCASKHPSTLIHQHTTHKYTLYICILQYTHTRIAPHSPIASSKNTNSSTAYRASNRRCRHTNVFCGVYMLLCPRKYVFFFFFFANKQILLK